MGELISRDFSSAVSEKWGQSCLCEFIHPSASLVWVGERAELHWVGLSSDSKSDVTSDFEKVTSLWVLISLFIKLGKFLAHTSVSVHTVYSHQTHHVSSRIPGSYSWASVDVQPCLIYLCLFLSVVPGILLSPSQRTGVIVSYTDVEWCLAHSRSVCYPSGCTKGWLLSTHCATSLKGGGWCEFLSRWFVFWILPHVNAH